MNFFVGFDAAGPWIVRTGRAAGAYIDGTVWMLLDHARKAVREQVDKQIAKLRSQRDAILHIREHDLPIEEPSIDIPAPPSMAGTESMRQAPGAHGVTGSADGSPAASASWHGQAGVSAQGSQETAEARPGSGAGRNDPVEPWPLMPRKLLAEEIVADARSLIDDLMLPPGLDRRGMK